MGFLKWGLTLAIVGLAAGIALLFNSGLHLEQHASHHSLKPTTGGDYIQSPKGIWLYRHTWSRADEYLAHPKSLVVIVHGFGEHAGRSGYNATGQFLASKGHRVVAIDHQGHGKSTGDRGHIENFDDYSNDLLFLIKTELDQIAEFQKAESQTAEVQYPPVFLLAHSMGTIVATHTMFLLQERTDLESSFLRNQIHGTILSGIAMEVDEAVLTPTVLKLIKTFSRYIPKMPIDSIPASLVSRNLQAVKRYEEDPLIFRTFLARWSEEFLTACFEMKEKTKLIDWPLLIVHGGEDGLTNVKGTHYVFEHSSTPEDAKSLRIFEGAFHELFEDEPVVQELFPMIEQFINKFSQFGTREL